MKANAEGSGRVGDKSNKSEDDVYSDAVTDFSDSGISPSLETRFESVREPNKIMEQKGVEGDLHGGGSLKVDEIAGKHYKGYLVYEYNDKFNIFNMSFLNILLCL